MQPTRRRIAASVYPMGKRLGPRYSWTIGLLVVLVTLGSILGAVTVNFLDLTERAELMAYIDGFIAAMAGVGENGSPLGLGSELLGLQSERMALRLVFLWLAGLTVIGLPLVLGYAFLYTFAVGFTVAFLVYQKGLPGLLLGTAALLPQNMFIFPALVVLGAAAVVYAMAVWDRSPGTSWWSAALLYSAACTAGGLLLAAAVVVEAYVTPVLVRWMSLLLS